MFGSAMMKVAESGRFAERREMIQYFTVVLIQSEVASGRRLPESEKGVRALVKHAAVFVDCIEEEAHDAR